MGVEKCQELAQPCAAEEQEAPGSPPEETKILLEEFSTDNMSRIRKPSLWRKFPWLGVFSYLLACTGVITTIVVLVKSDRQLVESWKVGPTLIALAAISTYNLSITFAITQGAAIRSRNHALRASMIKQLQDHTDSEKSTPSTSTAEKSHPSVVVAVLLSYVSFSNVWIIPRATKVVRVEKVITQSALTAFKLAESYTQIPSSQNTPSDTFQTQYTYLYLTATFMTLALVGVLPTFRGWQNFGCPASLDPVEETKASEASSLNARPEGSYTDEKLPGNERGS